MPKYRVYLQTVASTVVTVEAEDKDEAYDKALEVDLPDLCAQCSGWGRDIGIDLAGVWETDPGQPTSASIEEVHE
jgi:hypothetical protein